MTRYKTAPPFFEHVWTGAKTFEVRRDDRPHRIAVGDFVTLAEWDGDEFTEREIDVVVTYVLRGEDLPGDLDEVMDSDAIVFGFAVLETRDT